MNDAGLGAPEMPVLPHPDAGIDLATGVAGDTGAAGVTGVAGNGGVAGAGVAGDTGAAGAGPAGTSGAAGNPGAAGSVGSTGAAGDTSGAAGSVGSTGAAGDTSGVAGSVGSAGAGVAGSTGAAGIGAAGSTGAAGIGAAGSTGAAGAPACGPKTCPDGCCDNTGKCVAGRSLDRCGDKGVACATCGKCQICNGSGTCDVDPSSTWDVVCYSATIASTQPSGMTWDPRGSAVDGVAPDPFCQFEMPANSLTGARVSPSIADTYTPTWNYDITPNAKPIKAADLMSSVKTWRLWIGDDDGCNARGCMGQEICEIDQPLTAGSLLAGQLVEKNVGSCLSLTVKFVCEQ